MKRQCTALGAALLLAACTTASPPEQGSAESSYSATYRCEDGEAIAIEGRGSTVLLTAPESEPALLAAAPPESRSRFGDASQTIVIEESEALWMRAGKSPSTCRR